MRLLHRVLVILDILINQDKVKCNFVNKNKKNTASYLCTISILVFLLYRFFHFVTVISAILGEEKEMSVNVRDSIM